MSGDDLVNEYYVDYFLTHEADDVAFDYGQSDAEYHEGHTFADDDQMGVKRDSKYYMDYSLTHEKVKRKARIEKYIHGAFFPVKYDADNFVEYFLMHETDPRISSFDQSDWDYSKAFCFPFQDVSWNDSKNCMDYFLTREETDKTFISEQTTAPSLSKEPEEKDVEENVVGEEEGQEEEDFT